MRFVAELDATALPAVVYQPTRMDFGYTFCA